MKTAFIFPGQASQYVGMGQDLYETYPDAKNIFDTADEILGFDLKAVCFKGPEEKLKQTYITQPAIFVHSVAVFHLLKIKNITPEAVAGHSLGEYSALVAAGAMEFEDGLKLVQRRGELMHQAGREKPGTMAALIGLSPDKVYEICDQLKNEGIVQPANFNSPGQIAISGDITTVHKAIEQAKAAGAKKAVELVVSGAFHSPLMKDAQIGLKEALDKISIKDARVPLYSNVEAKPVQDAGRIRDLLYRQLTHPVRWQEIVENMIEDGYSNFYEVGPGKVLKGLQKRINRKIPCIEMGTVEQIEKSGEEA